MVTTMTAAQEPTVESLIGNITGLFDLVGNTVHEQIEPPLRPQLVVTEGNYRELALAEIARQNVAFGNQFPSGSIPVTKQAAITTAFQRLAGLDKGIPQETLDFLQANQDKLSLSGQTQEFLRRANNFAEVAVERATNVLDFVTSPFGLVTAGAVIVIVAVVLVR